MEIALLLVWLVVAESDRKLFESIVEKLVSWRESPCVRFPVSAADSRN